MSKRITIKSFCEKTGIDLSHEQRVSIAQRLKSKAAKTYTTEKSGATSYRARTYAPKTLTRSIVQMIDAALEG